MNGGNYTRIVTYDPLKPEPLSANVTFLFPGNTSVAPIDVPICGFSNEHCIVGKLTIKL